MLILPIRKIEAFDTTFDRAGLNFSVRIDGETVYGCFVPGIRQVSSGSETIGAFEDANKKSIVAWIDPTTNQFISLRPSWVYSILGILVLTVLLGVAILASVMLSLLYLGAILNRELTLAASITALLGSLTLLGYIMIRSRQPSPLEVHLREQLKRYRQCTN